MPLGFLPLGDLSVLLTGPALLQNLTSRNEATLSIFFQYTAFLTPFAFCSLVETLKKCYPRYPGVLAYLFLSSILMAGVSDFYIARSFEKTRSPHMREIPALLKQVPENTSVRTHEFLAPFLANRKELHIYENHHPREGGSQKALHSDEVVLDRIFPGTGDEDLKALREDYTQIFEKDGFMIFKRKIS